MVRITILMMRYVHYVISHLLTLNILVIYLSSELRDNLVYCLDVAHLCAI